MKSKAEKDTEKAKKQEAVDKENELSNMEATLFDTAAGTINARQRTWYRNILYYMGEQWIEWSKEKQRFEATYQYEGKDDPQPVSNMILDYCRSIKALILNKDVVYKVWPNSEEPDDQQASLLGGMVLEDMDAKDGHAIKDEQEMTILWMTIAGTGLIRDYPDMGLGKWIGATGIKTGDVATEALMPFNLFVGETPGTTLRKKPQIGIQGLKSEEWIRERFPDYIGGKETERQHGHDYQRSLMDMVGNISGWKGSEDRNYMKQMVGGSSEHRDNSVLFREIEVAPTKKYPKGRYIVRVGGQTILDIDRMPIPVGKDGSWFYTVEEVRHNLIPGGFWGEGGVSALISPQNIVNRIDQDLVKNRDDVAKPTVTVPIGTTFKTVSKNGTSIKVVEYDAIASGGVAPTVTHGVALGSQVLEERSIQKAVSQDASGDPKNVLKGQAPSGASGVAIDILRETAEAGHGPDIARVIRAFQRSARKRLIIAQEVYTEEHVLKISGAEGKISVKKFKGADLRNNTDVRLEMTTGFSTTNAGKVSIITDLLTAGIFDEQRTDPVTREELTRLVGLNGFNNKLSADSARAEAENAMISNGDADKIYIEMLLEDNDGNPVLDPDSGEPILVPVIDDPLFEIDDHQIHYEVWRQFVISPAFQDLKEGDKTIAMAHGHAHKKRIDLAMMQEREAAMVAGQDETAASAPQPASQEVA